MKTGRPLTLTPCVQRTLVRSLRSGSRVKAALAAAGVPPATFQRWHALGDVTGTNPERQVYRDFRDAVEQARAQAMDDAICRDWRIAAVRLQRLDAEREHWWPK